MPLEGAGEVVAGELAPLVGIEDLRPAVARGSWWPRSSLPGMAAGFVADSALEGSGFEPSVPRKAPGVVFVSILVRADFCVAGIEQRRHEPLSNPR